MRTVTPSAFGAALKTGALGAALLIGACLDPYGWLSVVSADPAQVTLRYNHFPRAGRPAQVDAMAEAQCAEFGRRARFAWDVEVFEQRRPPAAVGSATEAVAPGELGKFGNRHARFACVAA